MLAKPRLEDKLVWLGTRGMCLSEEECKVAGLSLVDFSLMSCVSRGSQASMGMGSDPEPA